MIQRIQTLYLLIATALMSVSIFTPIARFFDGVQEYTLSAFALKDAAGAVAQHASTSQDAPAWAKVLLVRNAELSRRQPGH